MRRSFAALTVGALSLIVLVVTYGVFRFTSENLSAKGGYKVYALFKDGMGIVPKTKVVIAGLQIGNIDDMIPEVETVQARVIIAVNPGIRLFKDALVRKKSASLLGEYYLEIAPGTPFVMQDGKRVPSPVLKDGDRIAFVQEPTAMGEIMDEVGSTMPILKDILRDVREMTSGNLKQIAENVNKMVATNSVVIERLVQRLDNIAANVEGIARDEGDDIRSTIQNVRQITEDIKGLVGTSKGEVSATGTEIRTSVQKLQKSIDSLEKSMDNMSQITGKVNEGKGSIGKFVNDDAIANNVEQITEDAGGFIRSITKLQTTIGLRTEYNALSNSFKNYFHVTLSPRPDRFYLIELVDDPRGLTEKTATSTTSSDRGVVRETTYRTTEKLRFSLMVGQRLGYVTGRFGLKESTGGIGMDVHLLDDRLTLSADLFDTRANIYPRLQGRAGLSIYKQNLFLVGGVDDVLNQSRSPISGGAFFDWFLGLNFQFRDSDLKTLLLFGGGSASAATK